MSEREEIIEAMRDDDQPTQCPECGIADEEFGLHEEGCPSGYPTRGSTIATADGVVIAQQRHIEIGEQRLSSDEIVSAWRKGRISRKVAEGLMRELDR